MRTHENEKMRGGECTFHFSDGRTCTVLVVRPKPTGLYKLVCF